MLALSLEAKFHLEERSKDRQVLTGSVAINLGQGSKASWLREERRKYLILLASQGRLLGFLRKLLNTFSPEPELFRSFTGLVCHLLMSAKFT